jgi:hypothetical protein
MAVSPKHQPSKAIHNFRGSPDAAQRVNAPLLHKSICIAQRGLL